jgi:hypothetical protein
MRHVLYIAAALVAFATPAAAVVVRGCDDGNNTAAVTNIAEPWEKNTKTFYNGQVRVALLDTGGEPACCSLHLLVMSPGASKDEPAYQECHVVSDHANFGFGNIGFEKLTAAYDPKKGLLITFPFIISNGDDEQHPGVAKLRLNLAKGTLAVEK